MDITSYLLGKKAGGGGGEVNLQSKSTTVTENGNQTIRPDSGYDGISKLILTTNVQPTLQTKSVTISNNGSTTVTKDNGYDGLQQVDITTSVQPVNQTKSITIDSNTTTTITPDENYDGLSSVEITTIVPSEPPVLESKQVPITSNGTVTVTPSTGYDGLSSVEINTNIEYQDYWPSVLNRSYSNTSSSGAWAFADTAVSIPAGTYLFTCNNTHVEVAGENANNNVNKVICKYSDNVDHNFYFGQTVGGFVFTSEVKKIALYLCRNTTLSNIKLLKIM